MGIKKTKNERNTENLVRTLLRETGYFADNNTFNVEEQKSENETINQILKKASKANTGSAGYPEFIITNPTQPDFLIVIECKASASDHISSIAPLLLTTTPPKESSEEKAIRTKRYAVDGALHYSDFLSKEFNVISIAISGEHRTSAEISVYFQSKNSKTPRRLNSKQLDGSSINEIISWDDFLDHATFDPQLRQSRLEDFMEFARDLHVFMRDHAKLTESEKPLLVSGTLIALRNKAFAASYALESVNTLSSSWMKAIKQEIAVAQIPKAKTDNMIQPYASIAVHAELAKSTSAYPKGAMNELIKRIYQKAAPFINANDGLDVLGQFYGEFLKYTGGDKKALGIVLTPRHITELFSLLANVNKQSVVLDICAGTGGFLISAMSQMMRTAKTKEEVDRIKEDGLIGVEQQPNMFALAASNMILRGDGKANLYQGSCFEPAIWKDIKKKCPDVGLLNPPFSQGDEGLHELKFIQHMLSILKEGGTGVAIVPMSCAISPHPVRKELLKNHTLEAVMSMPTELFYPVGVVCCIMVFTAHIPHETSNKKTWFGYWKDDGFYKTKHKGRVTPEGSWEKLRDRWTEAYRNREVHPGESVTRKVSADDEWCAEAYMETDYTKITEEDFKKVVKDYALFKLSTGGK